MLTFSDGYHPISASRSTCFCCFFPKLILGIFTKISSLFPCLLQLPYLFILIISCRNPPWHPGDAIKHIYFCLCPQLSIQFLLSLNSCRWRVALSHASETPAAGIFSFDPPQWLFVAQRNQSLDWSVATFRSTTRLTSAEDRSAKFLVDPESLMTHLVKPSQRWTQGNLNGWVSENPRLPNTYCHAV